MIGCLLASVLAAAAPTADIVVPRLERPVVVDGELSEWRGVAAIRIDRARQRNLFAGQSLSRDWAGPGDASAEIRLGWDDDAFYLAGEVVDDDLLPDDRVWWQGDCVELFLDVDREGDRGTWRWNDDDWQLCLMPYASGRPWGVSLHGREPLLSDAGLEGIEVAGRRTDGGGYRFEARFPFKAFPGFSPSRGIGFQVALHDYDRLGDGGRRESYLTIDGAARLYEDTRRLLDLSFQGAPAEAGPPGVLARASPWILRVLVALLLVAATALVAGPLYERLDRGVRSWRRLLPAVAVVVAVVALGVPMLLEFWREAEAGRRLEGVGRTLGRVVADLSEELARHEGRGLDAPATLLELLRGRRVAVSPRFDPECLDLRPAGTGRRVVDGVPVRLDALELPSERVFSLPLPRPTVLSKLWVFGAPTRASQARRPGEPLRFDDALLVGVRTLDGGERMEAFPLSDPRLTDEERRDGPRVRTAWREGGEVVDRFLLTADDLRDEAAEAVLLSLADRRVGFRLVGVTYATRERPDVLVPLVPGRSSRAGPVAAVWTSRGADRRVVVRGGRLEVRVGGTADVLWFFYDTGDPSVLEEERRGREEARIRVVYAGGGESVVPLRAGVHLGYSRSDPTRRPEGMESKVAFTFEGGALETVEMLSWFPPSERAPLAVERVVFENEGLATLSVFGVTVGRRRPLPETAPDSVLVDRGDHVRLRPDVAGALADAGLAVVRDGRVAAVDVAEPAAAAALRGTELAVGSGSETGEMRLAGGRYLVRTFPLRGDELRIAALCEIQDSQALAAAGRRALWIVAGVVLPLLLFYLVDLATGIGRFHLRLTMLLVATSLLPLTLLFAVLYQVVSTDRDRIRESRAEAALERVRNRLFEAERTVRHTALEVATSQMARSLLEGRAVAEEEVRDFLHQAVALAPVRGLDVGLRLEVEAEDGSRTLYHDRAGLASASRFDVGEPGMRTHWGRLVVAARETVRRGGASLTVTAAGEASRALRTELARAAGTDVGLYSLAGFPLTGERVLDPGARVRAADLVRERSRPAFAHARGDTLVALDVVRSRGEPAALVEVRLPPEGFAVDLIGRRLPLETFFLAFCTLALCAAVFVATVATRRIVRPLRSLAHAARDVAEGRLAIEGRLDRVEDRGEIGRVAEAFRRMTRRLQRREAERARLERALERFSVSLDLERVARVALELLSESPPAEAGAIYVDDGRGRQVRVASFGEAASLPRARAATEDGEGAEPQLHVRQPVREGERAEIDLDLPLASFGKPIGSLLLRYPDGIGSETVEKALPELAHLAGQAAIALANARLYRLAVLDPELDVHVETYLLRRLSEEIDRASEREAKVALLLLEPDLAGTRRARDRRHSLQWLAHAARATVRESQVVGRVAGRIAVVLPDAGVEQARTLAERIQRRLGDETAEATRIALRRGIAVFPDDARSARPLLEAAERALAAGETAPAGAGGAPEEAARPYVFRAPASRRLLREIVRVAPSDASVLVLGETGSGKDVVAELLHRFSRRSRGPFVALNVSALPLPLLEAELFGHEKGAFTGAERARPGRLEHAHGGTLFLDEIGELPLRAQAKLLRVLQDRRVTRLGGHREREVDVRVVTATNRDIEAEVRAGRFRADLLYRLRVVTLRVPPLRDRLEEIPDLVSDITERVSKRGDAPPKRFSPAALDRLHAHVWPGNVRELQNVVRRALLLADGEVVRAEDIQFDAASGEEARGGVTGEGGRPRRRRAGRSRELNERQRALFARVAPGEVFRSRDYFGWVGVSARTGLRDLQDLMARGLVERMGKRRGAAYRIVRRP